MKKNGFKILILSSLALLAMTATAPQSYAETSDRNVIRVGFFEAEGMFNGANENANKSGYCYDYMMHISSYTGWKYEFCYGTFSELYEKLKNGQIDILPYTNRNPQREKEVLFSDSEIADEEYYLVTGSKPVVDLASLKGARVATIYGYDSNSLLTGFLAKNRIDADIDYFPSIQDSWEALRKGKVDAAIWTSISYSKDAWRSLGTFGKKPTYICVTKGRPDILKELNEATSLIEKENPSLFDHLYEKYFSDNPLRNFLTAEERGWIEKHPVLHVGGFPNDAPYIFSYDKEANTATGLTVDIVNGIIDRLNLGITADFKCYASLADMEAALSSGELDVILPFYPDYYLAQQRDLIISNIVRVSNMELVYKIGTTYSEALTKIATPSTKLGIYYVRDNFPNSDVVCALNIQDAVYRVLSGEAKGAIAQNYVLHNIKGKYGNLNSIVLPTGCGTCFAARPENYPIIRILNRGLMYFSDAEISSISSKYTLEPTMSTRAFLAAHKDEVIIGIIAIIVILSLLLVLMVRLKRKADDSNKSKTTFLFNMSHDIRTPMNAILGYTDMALKHPNEPRTTQDCLQKIKVSGAHLLDLINDILEMSRIEAGKLELSMEPLDIRETITDTMNMAQALAGSKNIDLQVTVGELLNPYVYADDLHLNEVFINIISNAIKYSDDGGTVKFEMEQICEAIAGKARYKVTISDNGIGMSEEFQKHIFESFTREKSATISKQEGAGLGLSIVKRIVDLAEGTIDIQSKLGEGTKVIVELPFKVLAPEAIEAFKKGRNVATGDVDTIFLVGKKVLIVEDNELNREITEFNLHEAGMKTESVENGKEAVDLLTKKGVGHFDFILMDIQMPVMNGYEATKLIRALPGGDRIPIIALSANAFMEDKKTSLECGMNEHVAKPVDVEGLLSTLARLI